MATQTATVGAWGCPAHLVDSLEGGFTYTYDDVEFPGGPPRDNCDLAEPTTMQVPQPTSLPAPTASNTKQEIIDWLLANGVALSPPALANLTKAELLALVADVQD